MRLLECGGLLPDQLVAETDVVGEGCLGVLHGRIVGTDALSKGAWPGEPGGLCGFKNVARSSLDALEVDTIEQHDQIACLDRDAGRVRLAGGREPKSSAFQPLVDDYKAVGIPKKQLDAIPASVPENEEVTG
jgi:hypothetical protein